MEDNFFTFEQEDLVSDALLGVFIIPSTRETLEQIADDNSLLDEERQVLFETIKDVFKGKLEDTDIVGELFDKTEIELERGLAVQSAVYDQLLADIEDELDSQRQVYMDFNPEEFLPPDPSQKDLDEELAVEAVEKSGLIPTDEKFKDRLVDIISSHIKDIRDNEETISVLQKPLKTGGMSFTGEQAAKMLVFINEMLAKKDEKVKELEEEKKEWEEKVAQAKQTKEERLKLMEQPSSPEPPSQPAETKPEDIMLADEEEDEKEIEEIKEKADEVSAEPAVLPDDFLDKQTAQAVIDSKLELEDKEMKVRYRTFVEAFFRDLRDAFETKDKLLQSVEAGGLGLNPDEANRVMGILESKMVIYQAIMKETVVQQKTKFVADRQEKIMNEDAVREHAEAEQRDDLFQRVTGKRPSSVPTMSAEGADYAAEPGHLPSPKPILPTKPIVIPVVGVPTKKEPEDQPPVTGSAQGRQPASSSPPSRKEGSASPPTHSLDPKPAPVVSPTKPAKAEPPLNLPSIDDAKAGPVMLPTPEGCDLDKHKKEEDLDVLGLNSLEKEKPKPAVPAVKPAPAPKPAPATGPAQGRQPASSSPPSRKGGSASPPTQSLDPKPIQAPKPALAPAPAPASAPGDKKLVSDIKFTPKLTGPVEALRSTSLADFRRLSKEPTEATLKIKDKIDLLDEQSFEVKAEGIKAWHDSETNKLYLELLRASLEGKPVVDVIAEREAASQPALSKAEFDAVMELNRNLRFG